MKNLLGCFSVILFILLQGCQKETSVEIKKDTAIYDFVSANGSCTSPIIIGVWQEGKKLDATNTIVLPVEVKQKGSWSYEQSTNGIRLTGSGSFADSGYATISLQATGTPQKEGVYDFALPNTTGCSFQITVTPKSGTTTGGTSDGPFYYKATIGGTYYEALSKNVVTGPNDYWSGTGMAGHDYVNFSSDISPFTTALPTGYTTMEITKGILSNYTVATNATVKNFFAPGSYSYIRADSINFDNATGIFIIWNDKEGSFWSTKYGTGDQTGSTFKIISTEEYTEPGTTMYTLKVKMQFTCKLYKDNTGEMKQLTNGEMVGLFARVR